MNVRDLMTSNVRTCRAETSLAEAVRDMWEGDCGALPVVNDEGRVTGMFAEPVCEMMTRRSPCRR